MGGALGTSLKRRYLCLEGLRIEQQMQADTARELQGATQRAHVFFFIVLLVCAVFIFIYRNLQSVIWSVQVGSALALTWSVLLVAPKAVKHHHANIQVRAVEQGLRGEIAVARALAEGLGDGYYIINDITIATAEQETQIDHIVVSPREILCIETKNWRGIYRPGQSGWLWEPLAHGKGRPRWHKDPQVQSQMHCQALRSYLAKQGIDVPLLPLVVLADDDARWQGEIGVGTCPILYLEQLIPFIQQRAGLDPHDATCHKQATVAQAILNAHTKFEVI